MKNKTSSAALLIAAISASAALAFIPGFFAWREEHRARLQAEEVLAGIFPEAQAKALRVAAEKGKEAISPLVVGTFGAKTVVYSLGLVDAFRAAGVKTSHSIIAPDASSQSGLLISCDKSEEASKKKEALMDVLDEAGLAYKAIDMLDEAREQGVKGCLLYIGPNYH
ncbi:hypothetical protein [Insolitispirillum peregrinum]|uniref:hypothetical protein n=1 Tax=Insolitispirillum peregrinum TaxID=80876 RepID=UPI0036166F2E